MDPDVRLTLEALAHGSPAELAGRERWVEAFKTIGWAVDSSEGPALTAEGLRARAEFGKGVRHSVWPPFPRAPSSRRKRPLLS